MRATAVDFVVETISATTSSRPLLTGASRLSLGSVVAAQLPFGMCG